VKCSTKGNKRLRHTIGNSFLPYLVRPDVAQVDTSGHDPKPPHIIPDFETFE
jgi:hypothetical protein